MDVGLAAALSAALAALLPFAVRGAYSSLVYRHGRFAAARYLAPALAFVYDRRERAAQAMVLAEFQGRTAEALERADRLASQPGAIGLDLACINTLINGGRYHRALEVAAPWKEIPAYKVARHWGVLQVNAAEAQYNLGHWTEALRRLDRMSAAWTAVGIAAAGESQQRAWILAHLGRSGEARAAMGRVVVRDLPRIYHAEHRYTLARIALAEGNAAEALKWAEEGLALARRASSLRNGLFLRARARAAAGQADAALADFESAASASYRGQGGDGLLAWGDLLVKLGRPQEAQQAYSLAIERDPESESAALAAVRLGELPPAATI